MRCWCNLIAIVLPQYDESPEWYGGSRYGASLVQLWHAASARLATCLPPAVAVLIKDSRTGAVVSVTACAIAVVIVRQWRFEFRVQNRHYRAEVAHL